MSWLWDVVATPSFLVFQLLWPVALLVRWRSRTATRQLAWLLAGASRPRSRWWPGWSWPGRRAPGLLLTPLVPLAAGLAIVHGQHAAAYSALTWLSRSGVDPVALPAGLARATAESLHAAEASLWLGPEDGLHPVGLWPETGAEPPPASLAALSAPGQAVRAVSAGRGGDRRPRRSDVRTGCPGPRNGFSTTSPARPRSSSTTSA